jgi:hypothetical protein
MLAKSLTNSIEQGRQRKLRSKRELGSAMRDRLAGRRIGDASRNCSLAGRPMKVFPRPRIDRSQIARRRAGRSTEVYPGLYRGRSW